MRHFILILGLLASPPALTAPAEAELIYLQHGQQHRYIFSKSSETNDHTLTFMKNQQGTKKIKLGEHQVRTIKAEMTRIIWTAKYKKAKGVSTCNTYSKMKVGTDQAVICKENKKATGLTYGLLNSLSSLF